MLGRDSTNTAGTKLAADPPVAEWRKFLAQFQDVLVILLLVATAISGRTVGLRAGLGPAL